jgi:hypothetical protein
MKLTMEQSRRLMQERGIWVTAACDRCRRLLGAVRWTRRGEPGEWCSAPCREGVPGRSRSRRFVGTRHLGNALVLGRRDDLGSTRTTRESAVLIGSASIASQRHEIPPRNLLIIRN